MIMPMPQSAGRLEESHRVLGGPVPHVRSAKRAGRNGRTVPAMIGEAAAIRRLRSQIAAVGGRDTTVLICGESGTGKELVARHIHSHSPRRDGPFVTVDCTTLQSTLLESQLFGHVKGAFTGAQHSTLGLFRAAEGGTLFLDEVGELDPQVQAKLLRCIQDNVVVPLGGVKPMPVDVRVLAATHRDLSAMVGRGDFREDLFFRLDVIRLKVPPLRSRRGDILGLAEHLVGELAAPCGTLPKTFSETARAALVSYSWPGNVRELRNVVERALVFSQTVELSIADLPESLRCRASAPADVGARRIVPLAVAERCLIKRALRATRGNQTRAAKLLDVERHRLSRLIRRHGLQAHARTRAS